MIRKKKKPPDPGGDCQEFLFYYRSAVKKPPKHRDKGKTASLGRVCLLVLFLCLWPDKGKPAQIFEAESHIYIAAEFELKYRGKSEFKSGNEQKKSLGSLSPDSHDGNFKKKKLSKRKKLNKRTKTTKVVTDRSENMKLCSDKDVM